MPSSRYILRSRLWSHLWSRVEFVFRQEETTPPLRVSHRRSRRCHFLFTYRTSKSRRAQRDTRRYCSCRPMQCTRCWRDCQVLLRCLSNLRWQYQWFTLRTEYSLIYIWIVYHLVFFLYLKTLQFCVYVHLLSTNYLFFLPMISRQVG